jgi:hypothetical protein
VVRVTEKCCRENCGWPEADACRESEQPIPAGAELFSPAVKESEVPQSW